MSSGSARPRSTSSVCGKHAIRHQEHALLPGRRLLRLQPVEHRHRLGRRGALVEQRRRRDVHAGQVLHDRLEVQQRLEPALRDLRLVRRVGRVPAGILEDVAEDHARRDAVVVAHPDVRPRDRVARRDRPQPAQVAVLAVGLRQVERRRGRMPGGIVWSISASSDGTPIARSIASRSAVVRADVSGLERARVSCHRGRSEWLRGMPRPTWSARCTARRRAARTSRRIGDLQRRSSRSVRIGVDALPASRSARVFTSVTSPLTGAIQLRDRLHRLDRAEHVPLLERAADLRQLEIDDVAELLLRVVGDADLRLGRR